MPGIWTETYSQGTKTRTQTETPTFNVALTTGSSFIIQGRIADVSTAGSTFSVVSPFTGTIDKIYSTLGGAITTGDAVLSFELEGVAITGGGITIANAGSAAGDKDDSTPSAANTITAGNTIEQITDGGSTNAVGVELLYLCTRTV